MSNELKPVKPSEIAASKPNANSMTFTQTGDNGTQIGRADVVNNTFNVLLAGMPETGIGQFDWIGALSRLNCDRYNLFVKSGEIFDSAHFTITKKRSLTEYTSDEIREEYEPISLEAIEKIKIHPALFAGENDTYRGKSDPGRMAYVGIVIDVKVQDDDIKFYFYKMLSVPQDLINEKAVELGLGRPDRYNEMNCTHWTVKRINLIEELRSAGVKIPILKF